MRFPKKKYFFAHFLILGKRFRPGPLPQLHQAANRLMELGFRGFGIVLSGSVMIPMIFRSLTTSKKLPSGRPNRAQRTGHKL